MGVVKPRLGDFAGSEMLIATQIEEDLATVVLELPDDDYAVLSEAFDEGGIDALKDFMADTVQFITEEHAARHPGELPRWMVEGQRLKAVLTARSGMRGSVTLEGIGRFREGPAPGRHLGRRVN
jgi:hypothetical protein